MKNSKMWAVLAGAACATLIAAPLSAQTPTAEGIVAVVAASQDSAEWDSTDWGQGALGFVAGPELVVAAVPGGSQTFFLLLAAADTVETRHEAELLAYDIRSGLGLLAVPGLSSQPYAFARAPAQAGKEAASYSWEPGADAARTIEAQALEMASSEVEAVDTLAERRRGSISLGAAPQGRRNVGGPLLNTCGEVVGAVIATDRQADIAEASAVAVPASWLTAQFAADGLSIQTAADACLSEEERRAAEEERRRREQEAAVASERNRVDSLQQELQARDSVLAADSVRADSARAAQAQADSVRAAEDERTTQRIYVGGAIAALLILVVGLVGFRARRSARRSAARAAHAQQEIAKAQREAADAEGAAQAARSALDERSARDRMVGEVPGVLLEGNAERPIAVRVPGRSIANAGGAVVGRSPFESAVVLDHPEVSRKHFRLSAADGSVMVEDLGSTNGTAVDGAPLQPGVPVPLRPGATLTVGGLPLTVSMQRGSATRDTVRR